MAFGILGNLPWALLKTHRVCCYFVNQVIVFLEQSVIIGNTIARACTRARAPISWLPGGVDILGAWTLKTVGNASGFCRQNPQVFPYILTPRWLIHDQSPLTSHCPGHRVNAFRTAQLSMQRINSQESRVTFRQTALSWTLWQLWFVMVSIRWCQCWAEWWVQSMFTSCSK